MEGEFVLHEEPEFLLVKDVSDITKGTFIFDAASGNYSREQPEVEMSTKTLLGYHHDLKKQSVDISEKQDFVDFLIDVETTKVTTNLKKTNKEIVRWREGYKLRVNFVGWKFTTFAKKCFIFPSKFLVKKFFPRKNSCVALNI